jgi:thiamine kinase-like enzyme
MTQINGALEKYLKSEILPQVASPPFGCIDAFKISHQRPVYLYQDEPSQAKIVGKYFQYNSNDREEAWHKAEKEYFNLILLRDQIGLKGDHYNIVAPLGRNKVLSALLILEKAPGQTLDYFIARAIYENQTQELFYRLSDIARFFVRLHSKSDSGRSVSPKLPQWYLDKMLKALNGKLSGMSNQSGEIVNLAFDWWNRGGMFQDHEVIVHGDATPTNFMFHQGKVTGIDLEKMKWADRCWDLGFLAAELKHHFMWRADDDRKAEPFIGHFLWEYATAYGDNAIFYRITRRLPFYMALGLLRIARNDWLSEKYRYKLIGEAKQCLKYKP